ncbi:tripartite tricarboxylate transporter permease [Fodinicurvata sp. EGI_FJ10296]|uniref:tripartite tricarboxylate transporter permease n=1 Tax=Fodinicurvata sp. EGI_FJ10296 TaxID=3231908 RepID=UPI0034553ACD
MDAFIQAIGHITEPQTLLVIFLAAIYGLLVGSIPGLTATMSVALLVPVTFFMEPVPAIAAIVTTTATAIFAGDIPGALLRIPGTPASAAYVDEAYKMTRRGEGGYALGAGLVTSVIGGIIGTIILMALSPQLARVAIQFSSVEYFWLACLGLTCAVLISGPSPVRGALSLLIGLFIATVGIDIAVGYPRFTFGSVELLDGISFIPAMIAMFAISEILRNALKGDPGKDVEPPRVGPLFTGMGRMLRRYKVNILRSSLLGSGLGTLPGAGADIAAWISYTLGRRFSREPEKYGTGHVEGIVDGGSANNAAVAGAWTPALVFGIPGDTVTAIAIGILFLKGLTPGPLVFTEQPDLVYSVFLAFIVANIIMLPLGFMVIRISGMVLRVPMRILMPMILIFCIVGAYAVNNTLFAVWILFGLGIIAFLMEENDIPIAPAILGIVLGPMVEDRFMITVMRGQGSIVAFFDRPVSGVLGVLTVALWIAMIVKGVRGRRRELGITPSA